MSTQFAEYGVAIFAVASVAWTLATILAPKRNAAVEVAMIVQRYKRSFNQ